MFLANVAFVVVAAIVLPTCLADSYKKPFNCKGNTVNDDVREIALYYHNSLRTRINQGQTQDKTQAFLPKAENMYKMIYDCSLEDEAAQLVDNCATTYKKSQTHGINFKHFDANSTPTQLASPLTQILHTWSEQIVTKDWFADNKYNGDADIFEFSNMILAKTTAVGCSEKMCGTTASAACVFNEKDVAKNDELYKKGNPCTNDKECTTYNPSTCDAQNSLCVKADPNATPTPTTQAPSTQAPSTQGASTPAAGSTGQQTTSPATNPVTTPTTVSTTNAHVNPSINRICPTNSGVNDKIRNRTLEAHNWRRSELAMGRVPKRNGNLMPSSSNMIKLKYNCDLEIKARDHSRKCVDTPSDPATRPNTEENIFRIAKAAVPNRVEAIAQGVKGWWKTVRTEKPIGPALTFRDHHLNQPIRTFTRMAWATTSEIGCAVRDCGLTYVVVCQYKQGGNIPGQQIYAPGTPCGSCLANAQCDPREGLCVLP